MSESKLIRKLEDLEIHWDSRYELFAASSYSLLLVETKTGRIVQQFEIPSDGGDPDYIEIDGEEYLNK